MKNTIHHPENKKALNIEKTVQATTKPCFNCWIKHIRQELELIAAKNKRAWINEFTGGTAKDLVI